MIIRTRDYVRIHILPDNAKCKEAGKSPCDLDYCPLAKFDQFGMVCVPSDCEYYTEEIPTKREILFRGKNAYTGGWIYGDLLHNVDVVKIREQEQNIQCIAKSCAVIPETLGQYTGLTDIHGVKIFEGDIIEAHLDELFPDLATTLIVVWSNYGWFGRNMEGNVDSLEQKWVSDFFEIIGNIYDNPDLLEVSGKNG